MIACVILILDPGFRNIVHDKPAIQVGRAGPSDHVAEDGYIYRSLSAAEIRSAEQTGSFLPNSSGKSSGGQVNAKHWVKGGPQSGQFYRPDQTVVRVPQPAVRPDAPVQAAEAAAWGGGGEWGRLDVSASPGGRVERLLRTRDLELQMAQTANHVLGNSRTARNQITDQAFAGSPMVEGALHAGAAVATHGASLPGTAARIAGTGIRDRMELGFGKRAEAKADALAPILLNPDPVAAQQTARQLLARQEAWQRLVVSSRPKGVGMFGSAIGSQAAGVPLNY